jgi:hypothetical protein
MPPRRDSAASNAAIERSLRLRAEYNDLEEEYADCGDHDERCRCWSRMRQIASQLA